MNARFARAAAVVLMLSLLAPPVPSTAQQATGEPAGAEPAFEATIERIDRPTRRLMKGRSWRPGCPVAIRDLRYLTLRHHTFTGGTRMGELVVHQRWADEMVEVFGDLYEAKFPIRRMRLVDHYGANDTRSMEHDNTSAFNCRWRAGSPGVWSQHAYGRAIDVNPIENPYFVPPNYVSPKQGRKFIDRKKDRKGMIHKRDEVWTAFRRVGWKWGGTWNDVKDWQHFSATGQ